MKKNFPEIDFQKYINNSEDINLQNKYKILQNEYLMLQNKYNMLKTFRKTNILLIILNSLVLIVICTLINIYNVDINLINVICISVLSSAIYNCILDLIDSNAEIKICYEKANILIFCLLTLYFYLSFFH